MAFTRKALSRSNGSFLTGVMVVEGLIRRVYATMVRCALPEQSRIRTRSIGFLQGLRHVHVDANGIASVAIAGVSPARITRTFNFYKEAWIAV